MGRAHIFTQRAQNLLRGLGGGGIWFLRKSRKDAFMMTVAEQDTTRAQRTVRVLPMFSAAKVSPEFVVSVFGPLVLAQHALPAPEVEVEVERYLGWPIFWESGVGFSAQLSFHACDCLGWCDTIEEIRAEIDDEIADRRRSYAAHFHEDTPALDDTFHRIEMDVQ